MIEINTKFSRVDQLMTLLQERCGKCNTGDRFLSVRQIMEEFGVSQITVRQAMERLCESGVLEARDRSGYFVRRSRRFNKIAALVPQSDEGDYLDDLRETFSREALAVGFEAEVFTYHKGDDAVAMLSTIKADAILFRPYSQEMVTTACLNRVMSTPVPTILIHTAAPIENCRFVDSDNECCGFLAMTHLMLNGHRKFAVLLSEPDQPCIRQRVAGFLKCAEAYKLDVEILDPGILSGEHAPTRCRDFMAEYLRNHPKPKFTGLFIVSEAPALAVHSVAGECGLSVPEDLSLISLGHSLHGLKVDLTTVNTRRDQVIHYAVEMVRKHFAEDSMAVEQYKIVPEIHVGTTVKNINTSNEGKK